MPTSTVMAVRHNELIQIVCWRNLSLIRASSCAMSARNPEI